MPTIHLQGVNFPRWRFRGEPVFADRIYTNEAGFLNTESGAKVELTDDLAKSGPHGYGDFIVFKAGEDGMMTDDASLVPGSVFQVEGAPIPHALDVTAVSADPQGGRAPDQPEAGDPADPMAKPPVANDPIADLHEKRVVEEAKKDEPKKDEGKKDQPKAAG